MNKQIADNKLNVYKMTLQPCFLTFTWNITLYIISGYTFGVRLILFPLDEVSIPLSTNYEAYNSPVDLYILLLVLFLQVEFAHSQMFPQL